MTDMQAAIGLSQLEKVPGFVQKRQDHFNALAHRLKPYESVFILPSPTPQSDPSWFGFLITVKATAPFSKHDLVVFLEQNGVGTRQLFAGNMLRQPALTSASIAIRIIDSPLLRSDSLTSDHFAMLPHTDIVMTNTFWIGVWPGITSADLDKIESVFHSFFQKNAK
jgi:CDP-6-deoxy-D-xylo-4-hexulose-3-dehydrase